MATDTVSTESSARHPDAAPALVVTVQALTNGPEDRRLLHEAYNKVLRRQIPDKDEREPEKYFRKAIKNDLKSKTGDDRFHFLVALDQSGTPVGVRAMMYQAKSNTGMVQFWAVRGDLQGRGIGRQMDQAGESLLLADAQACQHPSHYFTAAEVNNPYKYEKEPPAIGRARVLKNYKNWYKMPFEYIQPALSKRQSAVKALDMFFRPAKGFQSTSISADLLLRHVGAYYVSGMSKDLDTLEEYKTLVTQHPPMSRELQGIPAHAYIRQSDEAQRQALARHLQTLHPQSTNPPLPEERALEIATGLLQNRPVLDKNLPVIADQHLKGSIETITNNILRSYEQFGRHAARDSVKKVAEYMYRQFPRSSIKDISEQAVKHLGERFMSQQRNAMETEPPSPQRREGRLQFAVAKLEDTVTNVKGLGSRLRH
jgi:hypothetical protein